jgi:C-terminal processing protease CtpA/Prc
MRKQGIIRAVWGAALLVAVMAGAGATRAAAQDRDTPWLGVSTQQITRDLRDGLDYQGSGILVNRVIEDSPADRAGLRNGDVIVSYNSRTVTTPQQLTELVRAGRIGQSVSLSIVRDGSRRSLTARLAAWPEDSEDLDRTPETPEAPEAPEPPESPRAPRAPQAERRMKLNLNGETFDLPDGSGAWMMRGMGRGRLGVQVQELNEGLADALGVTDRRGVLVIEVVKDTPAERAGIKAGDVIVRVGDRSIEDVDGLHRALPDRAGRVSVTIVRHGARRTVDADLDQAPQLEKLRSSDRPMMLKIPDIRTRVLRDLERSHLDVNRDRDTDRESMERELRSLRDEVRELKRKLEAMDKN